MVEHWPAAFFLAGLLAVAMSCTVGFLLKREASRAVGLWCGGGLLSGAGLLLGAWHAPSWQGWGFSGSLGLLGSGLVLQALALRQALGRPVKPWLALAACGLFVWALLAGPGRAPDEAPYFIWRTFLIACAWMSLAGWAWGIHRQRESASAVFLALLHGAASLAAAVAICTVAWGWPAGHAQMLGWLTIGIASLTSVLAHAGCLGLFMEQQHRQILQMAAQQARQVQTMHLREQMAQRDRRQGLGAVAGTLAHDLSQPLTNLYLITDRLALTLSDHSDAALQQCVQDLQSNTQQAGDLLGRLRALVPERLPLEAVPLGAVLSDVTCWMREVGMTAGVDLDVHLPPQALQVRGDAGGVAQILLDVLCNALEATAGQAERRIVMRAWREDQAVHLSVVDNGPGMTPEVLSQAGVDFFSTKASGVGVGLRMARSIAKHHGARLSVGNAPEGGACIQVQWPAWT